MRDDYMNEYGFLFGAGVEGGYGLPLGGKYTYDTILQKRTKMYKSLNLFYKNRLSEKYIDEYVRAYLFSNTSHTFTEMIFESAKKIDKESKMTTDEKKLVKLIPLYEKCLKTGNKTKEFNEKVKMLHKKIVTDESKNEFSSIQKKYKQIIDNLSYYGAIEKDFACIVNPYKVGKNRFWRLINYMWSAYFSIIIPLLDNSEKYKNKNEYKNDKYTFVLEHLKEITDYIYSAEFYDSYNKNDTDNNDYYLAIKENLSPYCFLTTNYTPFAKQCMNTDKMLNTAYLAGELSVFELPTELTVKDIRKDSIKKNDFIFPFMMTQAMVKPIINKYQLTEYSKAISYLEEIDTLIILGYSLCENDNHIVSLLRDYIMNPKKKIIYFEYDRDGTKNINSCKEKLRDKLKIDEDVLNRIELITHNGKANDVVNKIKERL